MKAIKSKAIKTVCFAMATSAGFLGCGNGDTQAFVDAAPTYSSMALDQTTADSDSSSAALGFGQQCHPHLFARTRNIVRRVNHHLLKLLARMDAVIDNHPDAITGSSATWHKDVLGYTIQAVGTKVSDTEYSFTTSLKKKGAADSTYVVIGTSTVDKTDGTAHTGKGTLVVDFDALAQVDSDSKATGKLTAAFDIESAGKNKTIEITLANFTPDDALKGPDGKAVLTPKNGHYVFTRENGIGGSLKFQDQMVLLCPDNPTLAAADVNTVARWSVSNGKAIGRADSQASGGQLPPGTKIVGVTCADLSVTDAVAGEKYWMMKEVDATGTVAAGTVGSDPATSCDAVFGAVPTADGSANDYDFSKVNFTDSSTVAFPGQQ
jgi:hypothetical protein